MIKRLNLPALTLPDPAHDSSGVEYMSSIINYTAWALASDTLTQLNNNVLNEIMINSHQRYQEADNTKNGRIFTTESRWRILYMIDPAGRSSPPKKCMTTMEKERENTVDINLKNLEKQ